MNINKKNGKYDITELTDHDIYKMAYAFSTISRLLDHVYYDLEYHKQKATEVKRTYADLSQSFFNILNDDYIIEGGGIEGYILPSIEIEIEALKRGLRTNTMNEKK